MDSGSAGNDAGSAPTGRHPARRSQATGLTVVTGTLEIGPTNLAGNVLHLQDSAVGGGPIVLDLNGEGASAAIAGETAPGDPLTVNAIGQDYLDTSGGFVVDGSFGGSINLADHGHLYVTGCTMNFGYAGTLTGGVGSKLTNYGTRAWRVERASQRAGHPAPSSRHRFGAGQWRWHARVPRLPQCLWLCGDQRPDHRRPARRTQSGVGRPDVDLDDPGDFHALISVDRVVGRGNVSGALNVVKADSFSILSGDRVMLTNGGRPIGLLRVAEAGYVPITASYGAASTTLTFHINPLGV